MKREEKSDLISASQSSLKEANGVFVVENHGLTVQEFEALRNELRPLVSIFKVVKNRLMKLALKDTDFETVSDMLKRPTAVAVATDGLAVTNVLAKFTALCNYPSFLPCWKYVVQLRAFWSNQHRAWHVYQQSMERKNDKIQKVHLLLLK